MDEMFMRMALEEARQGALCGEVPVGAVLVYKGQVIARAHNEVERKKSALAHAEMLCLERGAGVLDNWRLLETTLYCTLEPCPMCAGAMLQSRIGRLVWGAKDVRCGAHGSWVDLFEKPHPMHRLEIRSGVLAEECGEEMKSFFRKRRDGKTF